MKVNIDCSLILLLLSGMLALLKIAWIIGVIGVLILEKFGD